MPKLTEVVKEACNSLLVFGAPKSGKTEQVGRLAEDYTTAEGKVIPGMDLLWFDLENGSGTLKKLSPAAQSRITLVKIPDTRSVPMAIETMLKVVKGGPMEICVEHGKISCPLCKPKGLPADKVNVNDYIGNKNFAVVTDSLTQLTNSALANITRNKPDDYKLERDDWGNLGKLMDIYLSHVQAARYNTICISHESPVEMNDGKEKLVPVAGTRNFSRNSAKYFSNVVYTEVKNRQHNMESSTLYANNILTGSRDGIDLGKNRKLGLREFFL